jgi:sugar/nucleoside kinase (ribokinase family)
VEIVDTTGAGDVFRGALIDALLRGDAPHDILRFANAAAAISCTREGAIGGVPTRQEIEALIV